MTSVLDLINKKRQEVADRKAGQVDIYRIKNGTTTFRILPGWRGEDDPTFFHNFGQTWIKDFDKKVLAVVGDAKITYGEEDAIRNLVQLAYSQAATDAQRELYKEMLAKGRVLVNVQVLDDKEVDPDEARLMELSEAQFDNILEQAVLSKIADRFIDLEKGFDIIVNKTGKGKEGTKYTFLFERETRAVDPKIMETIKDIDAFIRASFKDHDRATNAIKSLMGTETLMIPAKGADYSGETALIKDSITEAEYDAVEAAKNEETPFDVETVKVTATDAEIEALFD